MTSRLRALIDQQRRLNGLSYADIARRAEARGEKLGKSNIGRVATGENLALSRATIFGLAAGLGILPATVARAALSDMGVELTEPEADAETAIRSDPTLPESGRRMLLALLGEIRAAAPAQAESECVEFTATPTPEEIALARETVIDEG